MRPSAFCDGTGSADIHMHGDYATVDNADVMKPMLAYNAANAAYPQDAKLAGTISATTVGKVPYGVRYPVIKYHEGMRTGTFDRKTANVRVEYDAPQPDGTYAVTVTRQASGTVITLR